MAGLRKQIMEAIDEAVSSGARLFKACEAIHLCIRRLRRWRKTEGDGRKGGYRAVAQKLSEPEKDAIVLALELPSVKDLPVKVAHATLMDQGIYLGSPSTYVRVAAERNVRKARKVLVSKPKRPELVATGPGQVWCWDITWLDAPLKGTYFYLYMVLDMFSRKVVAWEVFSKEDGTLARDLIAQALEDEGIPPGQITIHADNGRPMRSQSLRSLFDLLNVTASYGRPHTSNDNAFAESLFATFKGRVSFPEYFATLQSAREFCLEFFTWYNNFHLHSRLDYTTPMNVHQGLHTEIFSRRNVLLEENRLAHPSRHGGHKKVYGIPSEVKLKHRTTMTVAGVGI
jgi:transposase InsO family protein